jgi:hypothetical protein
LLDLLRERGGRGAARDDAIRRYGFAVPTAEALDVIAACSPRGVVELGAGTGYWARLLHDRGVDVVAYDLDPPPAAANRWFAGTEPWHPIEHGDEQAASRHADRTLLLVWPTRGEIWPADAVEGFHRAGGTTLVYVGEGPGGRCGDERFHALLGAIDHCYACEYGLTDAACTCDAIAVWSEVRSVDIPRWEGCDDRLRVYERAEPPATPGR